LYYKWLVNYGRHWSFGGAFPEHLHPFRATLETLLRDHPANPDDPRHSYDEVVELRRLQVALREPPGG
jgi:hypothetical protein